MRKALVLMLITSVLITGAGCCAQDPPQTAAPTKETSGDVIIISPTAPYTADPQAPTVHAISLPTIQRDTVAKDGTLIFQCAYQDPVLYLDDLQAQNAISQHLQRCTQTFLQEADLIMAAAQQDYDCQAGWTPYFAKLSYDAVRIDPQVLSLQCTIQSYDGSAHPSQYTMSATYDLTTLTPLNFGQIMVEDWSREDMVRKLLEVLEPSAPFLYEDYTQKISDMFIGDISWFPDWCLTNEGLCFLFPPYSIAPADSGIIRAQIPYAQLDGLLEETFHPQHTASNGSIYIDSYDPAQTDRFRHISRLTISEQGTPFLLYPDATISDVTLESGHITETGFQPERTLFAADPMSHGDALLIQADMEQIILRLTYRSEGQQVSTLLQYDPETDQVTFQ